MQSRRAPFLGADEARRMKGKGRWSSASATMRIARSRTGSQATVRADTTLPEANSSVCRALRSSSAAVSATQ